MSTEIMIPRERTYKICPGHYRAQVQNVVFKKAKTSDAQNCCINFEVYVPGMERYECVARAVISLDLRPGSQLRIFLESLLGSQYFTEHAGLPIDLNQVLRGLDCEIDVVHGPHDQEKYDWPMVLVVNATPVRPVVTKEEPTN